MVKLSRLLLAAPAHAGDDAPVRVVLASASPRRKQLLETCGLDVLVRPADVDETPQEGEAPADLVGRLARAKCFAVDAPDDDDVVVAADTVVVLDEQILNKPVDDADAFRMIRALAGRGHHVLTGTCVRRGADARARVVRTEVTFRTLDDDEIRAYLARGDHRDKAGAYGIQAAAGALVDTVVGSYPNVVGLPVREVLEDVRALVGDGA